MFLMKLKLTFLLVLLVFCCITFFLYLRLISVNKENGLVELKPKSKFSTTEKTDKASPPQLYFSKTTFYENVTFLKLPRLGSTHRCSKMICHISPQWNMIILIKSTLSHFQQRRLIRETWGSLQHVDAGNIYIVFIVGMTVNNRLKDILDLEQNEFSDILQINVEESYRNVILKTAAGLQWAFEYLYGDYLLSSADDDVIVSVDKLVYQISRYKKLMKKLGQTSFPILCMYKTWYIQSEPERNSSGKNYVSYELYPDKYWPRFCLGGMYTLSKEVAKRLWAASLTTPLLPVDDVWLTGVVREKAGITTDKVVAVRPPVARHFYTLNNDYRDTEYHEVWRKTLRILGSSGHCIC